MEDIFVAEKINKQKAETKTKTTPETTEEEEKKEEVKDTFDAAEKKYEEKELEQKGKFSHDDLLHFRNKEIGLFSSFHLYPSNVSFKDQENDEELVLLLRKHFATNYSWVLIVFVFSVLPIVFFIFQDFFPIPPLPAIFYVITLLFYYTIIVAYAYINFISWFFNISLVTQRRLIDIHSTDIIYHDMAVTRLNLIEDISLTQSGFFRSFFNYGDIYIQTAGEKMHFDFLAVPEPDHVLNIIQNLMGGERNVQ